MILQEAKHISIHNVLEGLRQGLSRFSGPSRVALVMAETKDAPLAVHDPDDLLRGHEPKLAKLYLHSARWREGAPDTGAMKPFGEFALAEKPSLTGLVRAGGYSQALFYQMWFTELHPHMCSQGPTERWLEHAVWLLAHDFASEGAFFTSASKHALQSFEKHAIKNHLFSELFKILGRAPRMPLYPILDAVLRVSVTLEEGKRPLGRLFFVEPEDEPRVPWLVRFPRQDRPLLQNAKHVRKLLQTVERSLRRLVSDGEHLLGISAPFSMDNRLTTDFQERHGFVRLGGRPLCSFVDGAFKSSTRKANLVHLEESLLECCRLPEEAHGLFHAASAIVDHARLEGYGATLVVDPRATCPRLAGQVVEPSLNLSRPDHLDMAKSLAKVDGALHIAGPGLLLGFACLLDGRAVESEDRSRGARFNSALRFSAEHPDLLVVVVSEDAPVSVFQDGKLQNAAAGVRRQTEVEMRPPRLEDWLEAQ